MQLMEGTRDWDLDFYPLDDGDSQKTLEQGNNRSSFKAGKDHLCWKQRKMCIGGKQNGDGKVAGMVHMGG